MLCSCYMWYPLWTNVQIDLCRAIKLTRPEVSAFLFESIPACVLFMCTAGEEKAKKSLVEEKENSLDKANKYGTWKPVAELFLPSINSVGQKIHCHHYCLLDCPQYSPQRSTLVGKPSTKNENIYHRIHLCCLWGFIQAEMIHFSV